MEIWIKIDELRPIVDSLKNNKITYGKATELITKCCKDRVELSKLSQHDVIKNEVAVCDACKAPYTGLDIGVGKCLNCDKKL